MDRPRWAWHQRIPIGGVTLMVGREGTGKTALVCWLAARLSRGQLPGEWRHRPADVVYIGHEDDRASVLVPRLEAAGADLDRFQFVDLADRAFAVAQDADRLTKALAGRSVALVVLDPLDSHLGAEIDSHKKAEVQATIGHLARAAQQLRCAALGLGHLNKAPIVDLLSRVVGSVGFTTAVRSVLAVGDHPDQPDHERVCVLAKSNLTDRTTVPAIRFRVDEVTLPHPAGDPQGITTGAVTILGEQHGITSNALLATDTDEKRSETDEAIDWLKAILADGPMPRAEIVRLAHNEHIGPKALRNARERLKVVIDRDKTARGKPSTWSLPGYVPSITCPTPRARNPQAPDEGEHVSDPDYVPVVDNGHVIDSEPASDADRHRLSDNPLPSHSDHTE
jgi:hypothetical protein